MMSPAFSRFLFSVVVINACSNSSQIPDPPASKIGSGEISINLSDEKQVMHSFGASDCWTGKFIGKWADVTKKNQLADLLFSTDTLPNGTPKGIGLSLWRFNIGAGSFEQGTASNISDEWRREESFQHADGSYDWNKQEGQRWFLQAARDRGVKYSLGFSISAPVHITKNGKAFSPGGTGFNLQSSKFGEFADFLVSVSEYLQLDYLSPANEPQWGWTAGTNGQAGQEGTPALNSELASLTKLLSEKIAFKGIKTKVVMAEAGQLDFLYGRNNDGRGNQVSEFFSSSSANYIGNLPNVAKIISAHSYFTTCPDDNLVNVRQTVQTKIKEVDPAIQVWQSEFGILGNICNLYSGYPRNTGIDYGLYVAKVIHHDVAIANASSWHWWLAMSPYDYSDALVYINAPDGSLNVGATKMDGQVLDSKQLWALGNYAHFVRPSMIRVGAVINGKEDPIAAAASTMITAYKDPTSKKLVIVIVNTSAENLTLNLSGVTVIGNKLKAYTTSATKSLTKSAATIDKITVDKRSVTTLVGTYR
jgi:O-Glycosyl hydrolase family 30